MISLNFESISPNMIVIISSVSSSSSPYNMSIIFNNSYLILSSSYNYLSSLLITLRSWESLYFSSSAYICCVYSWVAFFSSWNNWVIFFWSFFILSSLFSLVWISLSSFITSDYFWSSLLILAFSILSWIFGGSYRTSSKMKSWSIK